jgi:PAS domain S-box-containing protein
MADKLSYEELEQRVRQLDKEVVELKRSEEGLRSLAKNAPGPIITVDRDGIIRDINQTVAGLEIEKIVGTSHYDYAPPEYHKVMKESVEQVFKTGKSVSYEIAGVGPEESTSWYVTRLGPVKRGGEVVGVTIMPVDITERKRLENELSESEERYRAIFEGAAEGIVVADVKTRKFRYVNRAMSRMLGYTEKELVRMGVDDIHPQEALESVISEFEAQAKGDKVLAQGIPCLRKDGMTIYTNVNTTHMVIDGKECNVGFFADVTEHILAEEALRDSEEKWRSLTENSVDFIMTLECDGTLLFVNRTPPGVTREEVIGTSIFDHFPEKFKQVLRESINRVVETGEPDRHYIEYTSPDGITRHFEGRPAPIIHSGRVAAITINATDITEQKLAEQALRERETSLEIQADELQEVNTALRVLLRQRDKDKTELEEKVFLNVRELVMPHVEKLKKSTLDARQKGYLRVLESNLSEIISPFAHRLSSKYSTLTPTEIQMAFLIRDGKSTKEIAGLLNLSGRTVESHRQSIRVKMGIKNRKANLRSHLLSM